MENSQKIRENILVQPAYWMEKLNIDLYDAIITYQEKHSLENAELATSLGVSSSDLTQILKDGMSNFNTETLFSILMKLGKYPLIELVDKEDFMLYQN